MWSLDLTSGMDTRCPPWNQLQNNEDLGTEDVQPYTDGVAFRGIQDRTVNVQAGDGGTTAMDNMVTYNVSSQTWEQTPINQNGPLPESRSQMTATVNQTTGFAWFYGGRTAHTSEAHIQENFVSL
ncbi:hypothetical protein BCR43DRAFT_484433 [Syncephalastrum racemosum]|uniref:Galactose oxidase n=1 Tax=Syncephalastrum racemosum TaxID=13706 RepID=A0A1X2HKQ7_SYNRA|nr:hypothetical protein BCR43DRAFT_484433 [Syncephalastrum racemosum]